MTKPFVKIKLKTANVLPEDGRQLLLFRHQPYYYESVFRDGRRGWTATCSDCQEWTAIPDPGPDNRDKIAAWAEAHGQIGFR